MAKGDDKRAAQKEVQTGMSTMNTGQSRLTDNLYDSNKGFQSNYNTGAGANLTTYDDVMGKYNSLYADPFGNGGLGSGGEGGGFSSQTQGIYSDLANNGGGYGWDPMMRGAFGQAISGYGDFANTGGFTDQGISDIRARAVAPMRSMYGQAQKDIDRNRMLSGGSANYNASKAKMSRELGYGLADTATNAEAQIAQMIQQGRLAGLQGLSSTGAAGQGLSTDIDSLNARMKLAGLSGLDSIDARSAASRSGSDDDLFRARMGVLGGMESMYGTTPGLLNTTGNQLLASQQNLLQGQQLQNQGTQIGNELYGKKAGFGGGGGQSKTQTALQIAGTVAPYVGMAFSDKNMKKDIKPISEKNIFSKLKKLPISTWKYKGDDTEHIGPMAQDFKKIFNVGDGKTIALVDVMGVMMAAAKAGAR